MADSKSSGADTVVKVVLVFFISLLSFSIGTFVGKKFSDNQHKMANLEPHKLNKENLNQEIAGSLHRESQENESSQNLAATTEGEKSKNLMDEEELTEEQALALEEEMVGESHSKTKGHKAKSNNTKNESAQSENSRKLARMIASEMAQKGIGKYTVQVASYSSQEEAEKRVKELKNLKFESFSTETTIKGHQWYRVNVGLFATIKEAQSQKTQLADQAKITNAIIQKISSSSNNMRVPSSSDQ